MVGFVVAEKDGGNSHGTSQVLGPSMFTLLTALFAGVRTNGVIKRRCLHIHASIELDVCED